MMFLSRQYWFNNLWRGENSRERNRARYYEGVPFEQKAVLTALTMPDTARVWGIDISHWNAPYVNLARMVELYGLRFVIIKGCDGSLRSRYSAEHVATARAAGIAWGLYVWLYPNNKVSIEAQVRAWAEQAEEFDPPMGVFIDAEWTSYGGAAANPSAADLRLAHDLFRARYGRAASTYTAKGYADTYLKGFDWSREELWVANYGVPSPNLPAGASVYTLWQFSSTLDGERLDPNGNKELDGNYYNGGQAQFDERYGAGTVPGDGGEMQYIEGTALGSVKIRQAVEGDEYVPPRYLVKGDRIKASEVVNERWLKLFEINGQPAEGWSSAGASRQYIDWWWVTVPDEPEPPVAELPNIHITSAGNEFYPPFDFTVSPK